MAVKQRTRIDKTFSAYRNYKPYLRVEFDYQCCYCELNEAQLAGPRSFHIDHYRPKTKFPHLIAVYDNLIYSCASCNGFKGDHWPNIIEYLKGKVILNPYIHDLENHIDKSNDLWKARTKRGQWNIVQLHLSSDVIVKKRQYKRSTLNTIQRLKDTLIGWQEDLVSAQSNNNIFQINYCSENVETLMQEIEALESHILVNSD